MLKLSWLMSESCFFTAGVTATFKRQAKNHNGEREKKWTRRVPEGTVKSHAQVSTPGCICHLGEFLLRNARTENRVARLSPAGESIRTGLCLLRLYGILENSSSSGAKKRFERFMFDLQPRGQFQKLLQFSLPERDEEASLVGKSAVPTLWLSVYIPPKTSSTLCVIMYVTTYDICGRFIICSFILTLLWCWETETEQRGCSIKTTTSALSLSYTKETWLKGNGFGL